ncbi:hypothetical protein D3C73_1567130 [compost metagenome]
MFPVFFDSDSPVLIVGRIALNRVFPTLELRIPDPLVTEEVPEGRFQVQFRIA